MCLFYDCSKLCKPLLDATVTGSTTLRVEFQEAIKILTGGTKYQGIDGYFCGNVAYPEICKYCYHDSHLLTSKLSVARCQNLIWTNNGSAL